MKQDEMKDGTAKEGAEELDGCRYNHHLGLYQVESRAIFLMSPDMYEDFKALLKRRGKAVHEYLSQAAGAELLRDLGYPVGPQGDVSAVAWRISPSLG